MIKILITVIFIVASLFGGLYIVHSQYEDYQGQIKENEALYEELENIVVYVAELKKIKREIENHKKDIGKIEKAFPEDHDTPSLFLYLKELVEEKNLIPERDFGDFAVQEYVDDGTEHQRIKETLFDLQLQGDYEDVKSFFNETERLMRMMSIGRLGIMGEGAQMDPFGRSEARREKEIIINIEGKSYSY